MKVKSVTLYPHTVNGGMFVMAAFRYALGRRTYAVGCVADELLRFADAMDPFDKTLIASEIRVALDKGEAGDECDVRAWTEVAERMEA